MGQKSTQYDNFVPGIPEKLSAMFGSSHLVRKELNILWVRKVRSMTILFPE
jgi:hypothetical protein